MKLFITLLLLLTLSAFGQTNQLVLPKQFALMVFSETTIKTSKKIIGQPTAEKSSWVNANLGFTCIRTFLTTLSYNTIGCEMIFYSVEKDRKDKKALSSITFTSGALIAINNTLKFNLSDTLAVQNIFGVKRDWLIDKEKKELNWFYKLNLLGQNVEARFVFNDKGILQSLEVREET